MEKTHIVLDQVNYKKSQFVNHKLMNKIQFDRKPKEEIQVHW
jgi:hypothetical protein